MVKQAISWTEEIKQHTFTNGSAWITVGYKVKYTISQATDYGIQLGRAKSACGCFFLQT